MSGWIKWHKGLVTKPEVMQMAKMLKMDPHEVAGRLMRVWEWADDQTENGNAIVTEKSYLDALHGATGFTEAMVNVGWLEISQGGVKFPNFDRHMSQTAKKRALTAERVKRFRNASRSNKSLPEKRREDKIREYKSPPLSPQNDETRNCPFDEIIAFWNEHAGNRPAPRCLTEGRRRKLRARWKEAEFRNGWREAILKLEASAFCNGRVAGADGRTWIADFDWFIRSADSCVKTLEGKYDDRDSRTTPRPASASERNAKYEHLRARE